MTQDPQFERYIEALRDDLPSPHDERRIRHRMAGAGIAVAATAATKTAVGAGTVAKVGLLPTLMTRLAHLPLLTQLGLVTAGTAAVATGPVIVVNHLVSGSADTHVAGTQRATNPLSRQQGLAISTPGNAAPSRTSALNEPPAQDGVAVRNASGFGAGTLASAIPGENAASSRASASEGRRAAGDAFAASRNAATAHGSAITHEATADNAVTTTETQAAHVAIEPRRGNGSTAIDEAANTTESNRKPSDSSQLAEETRLIDAALTSIRSGNLTLAHRLLKEHSLRFPHAKLAKEHGRAIQKLEEAELHAQP